MTRTLSRGLILAIGFTFFASIAQAQQYASYVMDARTGKVIQASNAETRVHPASLTKMMTLYMMFEALDGGRLSLATEIPRLRSALEREFRALGSFDERPPSGTPATSKDSAN